MNPDNVACPSCCSHDVMFSRKRKLYICENCGHTFEINKEPARRRVFISYGHDEHAPLAARLKKDLEARGHEVWFDLDRLNPGGDWEAYIEEGLDWVAIDPNLGRVVLLMTPHSVRRPDGYCLNEIARAFARRLVVIPIMVIWSEPPLSICRIQWLDMRDCVPIQERGEKYESKFERLCEALESDRLDFGGAQSRFLRLLEPLPFDADIAQHMARFTGRQWVLDHVDSWLADPKAARIFWIVGKPGAGKTAIASWLCYHRREIAALHLCRHGHVQKSDPRRCVLSIAYQLSTQLPDYQSRLNALNLDQIVPESDARTLFDLLIAQPLSANFPKPDRDVVALIDALDEATEGSKNDLAAFIASEFAKTPDWLRLIITSRPDPEVKHPLQGLTPYVLDTSSSENEQDIREFLLRELKPYVGDADVLPSAIDAILTRSGGVFLYIECVRQELAQGHLSLDRLDEFPQGLGGLYAQFFERRFPDLNAYENEIRPALECIAAAQEPLELEMIASIFEWNEYTQAKICRSLGSLFTNADGLVQPFHQSLMDWVTDPDRAGSYFVSAREGHKRLADYGWQEYQKGIATMSRYALIHLSRHLTALKRWDELSELLCSEGFVIARKDDNAGRHFLIKDFREAVVALPNTLCQRLWEAPLTCVLFALYGIGDLIDQGGLGQGKAILEGSESILLARELPQLTNLWCCLAGRLAIYDGNLEEAERQLSKALNIANDAGFEEGVAKALLAIGVLIRKFDNSTLDAHNVLQRALKADFSSYDADFRSRVLLNLCMVHVHKGQAEMALDCLEKARSAVTESGSLIPKAWLLKYEGFARLLQSEFGLAAQQFNSASEVFAQLGNKAESERCRELMVYAMAPMVGWKAQERVHSFEGEHHSTHFRVEAQEKIRSLLGAIQMSSGIPDESEARRVAAVTHELFMWIQRLERKFDPEPPAGLTKGRRD